MEMLTSKGFPAKVGDSVGDSGQTWFMNHELLMLDDKCWAPVHLASCVAGGVTRLCWLHAWLYAASLRIVKHQGRLGTHLYVQ